MQSAPWHKPHPLKKPRRKVRDAFYGTARWLKFRLYMLAHKPLCEDPFGHHILDRQTVPATEVHHLIPRKERPDLAYVPSNMQCLCKSCHSRISAEERANG